jgi:hypothetical protein
MNLAARPRERQREPMKTTQTATILLLSLILSACGDAGDPGGDRLCTPNETRSCLCPGGRSGVQSCTSSGDGYTSCAGCSASATCGDGTCNGSETCSSCRQDCGACGATCGDGSCNGGETCSSCSTDCGPCSSTCSAGETRCSGSCVNLASDRSNCGTCGNACSGSSQCISGRCQTSSPSCVSVGSACTSASTCCPDPSSGVRALCTNFEGASSCASTCTSNSQCNSGCCALRDDGQRVCAASRFCATPACRTCTTDASCGSGFRCATRLCDGIRGCFPSNDPSFGCDMIGGIRCPAVGLYNRCSSNSQCASGALCLPVVTGRASVCMLRCSTAADCPVPAGFIGVCGSDGRCFLGCTVGGASCPQGTFCGNVTPGTNTGFCS